MPIFFSERQTKKAKFYIISIKLSIFLLFKKRVKVIKKAINIIKTKK